MRLDREETCWPIFAIFVGGAAMALLAVVLPKPLPVARPGFWLVLAATCLTASSPFWLPQVVFERLNYPLVGLGLTLAGIGTTGWSRSPLLPLFVLDVVAAAVFLRQSRSAYLYALLAALISAIPFLVRPSPAVRSEFLLVPMLFAATFLVNRTTVYMQDARRARLVLAGLTAVSELDEQSSLEEKLRHLTQVLRTRTDAHAAALYLKEEDSWLFDLAWPRTACRDLRLSTEAWRRLGEGLAGTVAKEGKAILVRDALRQGFFVECRGEALSALAVPLPMGQEILGTLCLGRVGRPRFREAELALAQIFARHAAVIIQNARLLEATRRLAITDPLTGLYNRRYLSEELPRAVARAERRGSMVSLIMIDTDSLKGINDGYGHAVGDRFLVELARVLQHQVRAGDVVVRYAGDEFVILLPDTNDVEAKVVAERVRGSVIGLSLPVDVEATVSIGIATYPIHARDPEELLKRADQALYASKRAGKNCTTIYEKAVG